MVNFYFFLILFNKRGRHRWPTETVGEWGTLTTQQMALEGSKLVHSERLITKPSVHLLGDCEETETFEQRCQIGVRP